MVTLASVGYFIRVSLTSSLCVFFLSSFLPSSKAPELAHPARQSSIVSSLLWLGATWAAVGVLAIVQSVRAGYWLGRNPEWKWVGESVVVGTLIWLYAAWTVANGESCSASWLKGLAFAALAGNSAMDVVLTLRAVTSKSIKSVVNATWTFHFVLTTLRAFLSVRLLAALYDTRLFA